MRPGLPVDLALGLLLDAVVSDRGRGVEAVVDVRLGEVVDQARLDGVSSPDARVAVGLQLGADAAAFGPLRVVADAVEHAELVLDVVAVLVGDDVGLDEGRVLGAELGLELVEEAEVDVDALVAGQ